MKRAVLVPNIEGFPSESMRRYARELERALTEEAGEHWRISRLQCKPPLILEMALGSPMASRYSRWFGYPRLVRSQQGQGDVFHILDHSHANLANAVSAGHAVVTCHDIIPLLAARGLVPVPCSLTQRLMFPLRLQAMKRCRLVIAISEATRQTLIHHARIPAESIRVVHYGVNPRFRAVMDAREGEAVRQEIFSRLGIPWSSFVILQVATAVRYKNTPVLLKALARLSTRGQVRLVRVGAEMFADEQKLASNLGIERQLHFVGSISDDLQLLKFYQAADVLAFPSLWEGFGWPPLEAMACGTPVVCSTIPSLEEVVGEAGLRVPAEDDEALAEALHRIWKSPALRSTLARKGLARAARFTWQSCARGTLAVYDGCIS